MPVSELAADAAQRRANVFPKPAQLVADAFQAARAARFAVLVDGAGHQRGIAMLEIEPPGDEGLDAQRGCELVGCKTVETTFVKQKEVDGPVHPLAGRQQRQAPSRLTT